MRWMSAGAYTMKHWRGILLGMWAGTLALFGLIAWWGYDNRDGGLGAFTFTLFGFLVLAMLVRFPRRLIRSMRSARRAPQGNATPPGVIDTDATVRDRGRSDPPPLGPARDQPRT